MKHKGQKVKTAVYCIHSIIEIRPKYTFLFFDWFFNCWRVYWYFL